MPRRSQQTAAPLIPSKPTISKLRTVAAGCQACDLWKLGTQTVFGEGGSKPRVMFVGEQPGDQEDRQGRPFVGPAGKILDSALEAAGIDRQTDLCDECRETFQMGAAGQAPHPQKAELLTDQRMQAVA